MLSSPPPKCWSHQNKHEEVAINLSKLEIFPLVILQRTYQELIHSEGMVEHLVRGLKTTDKELQKHCALPSSR